ncbi:Fe2+-dependent dioxygenase [Marinobacter adhaerens]|jgi:PKHD-type hydroxylase|uniref:Fe2+-dependent dioxygenase n=1 Tax=Marinobacter adhaerens TaxID=1033846 RepID=UPI003D298071
MLTVIEQVLTPAEINEFRHQLQRGDWQDGALSAGARAASVKHNQQLSDHTEVARKLSHHLLQRLGSHPLFVSAALPERIYPPKFNRYRDGGHYGTHVDAAVMAFDEGRITLRSDLSVTLFLTDPDDYDGGELTIETGFGTQQIKLAAGDLVLYPSSSLHRVEPVTRGERVSSFFWVQSLVADDGKRSLLFDLDQAIQGLTPDRPPQDPELLRLTGVYHNLLRTWASV